MAHQPKLERNTDAHPTVATSAQVVIQLMAYIERTLERKLSSLEVLIDRNIRDLKFVSQQTEQAKRDVKSLSRLPDLDKSVSKTKLISDDIRFYMHLVRKGKAPADAEKQLEQEHVHNRSPVLQRAPSSKNSHPLDSASTSTCRKRPNPNQSVVNVQQQQTQLQHFTPRKSVGNLPKDVVHNLNRTQERISALNASVVQKTLTPTKFSAVKAKIDTNLQALRLVDTQVLRDNQNDRNTQNRRSISRSVSSPGLQHTRPITKRVVHDHSSSLRVATAATLSVATRALQDLTRRENAEESQPKVPAEHQHTETTATDRFGSGDTVQHTKTQIEKWKQTFRLLGCNLDDTARGPPDSRQSLSIDDTCWEDKQTKPTVTLTTSAYLGKDVLGRHKPSPRWVIPTELSRKDVKPTTVERIIVKEDIVRVQREEPRNIFLETLKDPQVLKEITQGLGRVDDEPASQEDSGRGLTSSERSHVRELMNQCSPSTDPKVSPNLVHLGEEHRKVEESNKNPTKQSVTQQVRKKIPHVESLSLCVTEQENRNNPQQHVHQHKEQSQQQKNARAGKETETHTNSRFPATK